MREEGIDEAEIEEEEDKLVMEQLKVESMMTKQERILKYLRAMRANLPLIDY